MKKIFFLGLFLGACAGASAQVTTIEAYGKNTTTIEDNGNGTTTTTISCDTFYQTKCYSLTTTGPIKRGISMQLRSFAPTGVYSVSGVIEDFMITKGNDLLELTFSPAVE